MEEKLPSDDFIRVHRSFIIRKDCIRMIEGNKIALDKRSIPIGEVYRKKLKSYISNYSVL
ncbi:LytTR family DNA-binding domain-containing protein [Bacteroides stercorirosoris]|nr:LytTR family DNA-binding domain-containing protein [Bacteroides stercorirosoris]